MSDISKTICKDLRAGKVISLHTDTVNGLICSADCDGAVSEIYSLKDRNINKPLSIIISDLSMAERYISVTPINRKLLLDDNYSFTVISKMKENSNLSKNINQVNSNIALRIPKNPLLLEIIENLTIPVVATSANKTGEKILNTADEISRTFDGKVKFYATTHNITNTPSAIIDCIENKIIRATKSQKEYIDGIFKTF